MYFSRTLVISWGCFGWLLPMKYHIVLQACHVFMASKLIPVTCSANPGSFMMQNESKFRYVMQVLDWPFSFLPSDAPAMLNDQTNTRSACIAINLYLLISFAFLLPSFLILINSRDIAIRTPILRQEGWLFLFLAIELCWCVIRLFVITT